MNQNEVVEVKMYGMEVKGTPQQIAELKKLLDEQNTVKIEFVPVYPNPWQAYPTQPFITYDKTTVPPWTITAGGSTIGVMQGVNSWNSDPTINGNNSATTSATNITYYSN